MHTCIPAMDDNWFLMCNYSIFYNMLNKPLSYELTFSAIEKFSQIAVFNLQASDYVHCEDEEGTNPNVSLQINTLVI